MTNVIFGALSGRVIDNRDKKIFQIEDNSDFNDFEEFDPGNPIRAFIGGTGFLVFDPGVDLIDALLQYVRRAADESCGKCTPCRVGLPVIRTKLEALARGEAGVDVLDEIEEIAEQVRSTSLCGLGQTSPVALVEMLRHFRDELERRIEERPLVAEQPCTTYVTAPCIEACPSKVDVPRYIDYIKDGKFAHSIGVILEKYPMAASCGRVCVRFCEMACRRTQVDEAVGIKVLKRFVADQEGDIRDQWFSRDLIEDKKPDDMKVAVVGAGPAGISAAYHLLLRGYPVDLFEALDEPGGMAAMGIPAYRLPPDVRRNDIRIIESLGGRFHFNQRMGRDFTLQSLQDSGYHAIFLGIGAHRGKKMGLAEEDQPLKGYEFGVSLLLYINHDYINGGKKRDLGRSMVVVGGGNVAMDCARSALRLGVEEVHVVYRRAREQMPADPEEVEAAIEEGVQFHFLCNPRRLIVKDGTVTGVELVRMKLSDPDESGRRSVVPIEDSSFTLDTDMVVPAIGQQVDHRFVEPEDGISFDRWGMIEANAKTLMTNRRGVFAGGDCVMGPATFIQAMAQGEKAARGIDDFLTHGRVRFAREDRMSELLASIRKFERKVPIPVKHEYRIKLRELDPEVRREMFEEVEKPISVEEAYHEANRCMRCYRVYSVITEK